MTSSAGRVVTVARHEYRAAARSRVLVALLAILVAATVASIYIGATAFRGQMADYLAYRAAARASGIARVAPPPLAVLSLLRGAVEYIEIVGAVFAIALGYLAISRERAARTMPLLRTRPLSTTELVAGNLLGAAAVITTLVIVTGAVAVVCLGVIGHAWIAGAEALKVSLTCGAAVAYMVAFYCLGAILTATTRTPANGLMIALGLWLVVVLILPQIGDTLDPDNQVPGGLFAALTLNPAQQSTVQHHLGVAEHIRTSIEWLSFEKHFERFAFAMTDVKDSRRGYSLTRLLGIARTDLAWIALYLTAMVALLARTFRRRSTHL